MRLLRSKDLTFEPLESLQTTPRYAILSHTWDEGEITYKEMKKHRDEVVEKKGYQKIKAFAERALANGFDYIWVDTCCIDKSSSAELSEAINSMFRLYREAAVCYAFLNDVPARKNHPLWTGQFQASRWFTRGWTLQELISPRLLEFYAADWTWMGTKVDLAQPITAKTGIPYEVVVGSSFSNTSIAQRMSWSAGRQTSRKEDAAYCLMGLFDVNMPMLYGEGDRAFLRLQEEIIKTSDDMSIFAWVSEKASFSAYRGLLAQSPSDFAQCSDIHWARGTSNEPYQITNKGVHISLPFVARESTSQELVALLRGVRKKPNIKLGIFLQKVGEEQYARIETNQLAMDLGSANSPTPCFIRQNIFMETASHSRAAGISLRTDSTILELLDVQPSTNWNDDTKFFAFDAPIALRTPPLAVFALRSTNTGGSGIKISVDAGKQWGAVLQIEKGWSTAPALTQFTHKIHCRKPRQPVIEVLTERGVFEGESQIVLSVVALSDDEDDGPPFKHRKLQKSFTDGMMPIRGERKQFYLD